jgi:S1-C subfamily serine protease
MKSSAIRPYLVVAVLGVIVAAGSQVGLAQAQQRSITRNVQIIDGSSAFLGIEMQEVTADNMASYKLPSERGVIVRSVEKGSPAEAAGIQEKDVILEFGGTPVLSTAQLGRLVREMPTGRKVDLVVSRDGKKLNLSAKLASREGPDGHRSVQVVPGGEDRRAFRFYSPDGQTWGFQAPRGRDFTFEMPAVPGLLERAEERPRLGVTLQPLTDQMAEFLSVPGKKGVLVTGTVEGAPAVGKLKAGDVITAADGQSVDSPEALTSIVRKKDSGAKIDLKVIRDKKEMTMSIELAKTDAKQRGGYRL